MRVTPRRKQVFLSELGRHGCATRAARAASPGADPKHGAVASFRDERRRDPAFASAWGEALRMSRGELHR